LERKLLIFLEQPHFKLNERLRPMLSHDDKRLVYKITDEYIRKTEQRRGRKMKTSTYSLLGTYQIGKYPEGYFVVSIHSEKHDLIHSEHELGIKMKFGAIAIKSFPETRTFLNNILKRRKKELPSEFTITIRYREHVGGRPHVRLVKRTSWPNHIWGLTRKAETGWKEGKNISCYSGYHYQNIYCFEPSHPN